MIAGHTFLKVIAGFAWSMMKGGTFLFLAHVFLLLVLFLLVGLELGVAVINPLDAQLYLHQALCFLKS